MKHTIAISSRPQYRQRGMATILIALFIGVAVTATSLGILHSIRSTQERQLSMHAQTHSQGAVWTAVEALRLHFLSLDEASLIGFADTFNNSSSPVSIGGVLSDSDTLEGYVYRITRNEVANPDPNAAVEYDGTYDLYIRIAAIDASAQAASNLEVVYKVQPFVPSDTRLVKPGVHLRKQSSASGDFTTNMPEGADFQVDGNMTLSGSAVTDMGDRALGIIGATGDVTISSDIHADKIHSNGNIDISASATATEIWSAGDASLNKGKIDISGDSGVVDDLWANNDIVIASGGEFKIVRGRGTVAVSGDAHLTNYVKASSELVTDAPYAANDVTIGGIAEAGSIYSKGALTYSDNDNPAGQLKSQQAVSCGGTAPVGGVLAPQVTACNDADGNPIAGLTNSVVTVDKVDEVTKFVMPPPHIINVYDERAHAHYAFARENGKDRVYVSNVNGIAPANYFVGTVGVGNSEYICDAVDDSGVCVGPYIYADHHLYGTDDQVIYSDALYRAKHGNPGVIGGAGWELISSTAPAAINPIGRLCGKVENDPGCFSYTTPTATAGGWVVDSSAGIAPGVVWFDSNVSVSGVMFNTVLAVGNITATGTDPTIVAANWAGSALLCDMEASFTYINATSITGVDNGQIIYDDAGGNNDGINDFDEIVFVEKNTTTVSIAADIYGDQYLTNYCGANGTEWSLQSIGNSALMAGSYTDADLTTTAYEPSTVYQGGHITIASGSEILGMVMAGDVLTTSGNVVIYGYVTASGLGGGASNSIGASSKFDTRFLSDEMKEILGEWKSTVTPAVEGQSTVLWSFYR